MSDDPQRAVLGKLVDDALALATLLDSIDLTKYDTDELAELLLLLGVVSPNPRNF